MSRSTFYLIHCCTITAKCFYSFSPQWQSPRWPLSDDVIWKPIPFHMYWVYMIEEIMWLIHLLSMIVCLSKCRKESGPSKCNRRRVQKDCKSKCHSTMVFAKGCCQKNAGCQIWRSHRFLVINYRCRKRVVSWGCRLWFLYGFHTAIGSGMHILIWVLYLSLSVIWAPTIFLNNTTD